MADLKFPDVSVLPSSDGYVEGHIDNTIRSEMESGHEFARPLGTKRSPRTWKMKYNYVVHAEKESVRDFVDNFALGTSTGFTWANPVDSVEYQVRFNTLPEYTYMSNQTGVAPDGNTYSFELDLREIY